MITKVKDPDEDLDYTWDFDDVIAASESIASYSFPSPPLTLHDDAGSTRAVTAYVSSGGTLGSNYEVTCRVVTNATPPRTFDRTIKFHMAKL